ncbi:MAG: 4-hydroxythreonine-4-phosphate dehydrogenase PdxA [Pseudomonadales bacterium]|jgi:4-hydroxythreonine-4-phosphate dehydrogenase
MKIAITPGEPAGIGPDICVQTCNKLSEDLQPFYFADPILLSERARLLDINLDINECASTDDYKPAMMNVIPVRLNATCQAGLLDTRNAPYVIEALRYALEYCVSGKTDALVTGPVNKAVINDAGIKFSGHTEWLADATNTAKVVMMLAAGDLKVALATTHLPLRDVAAALNKSELKQVIQIIDTDLRQKFGIKHPTLLVCGLNPHAGEGGHLGNEEIEVISPVLEELRKSGLKLIGPIPADTAFTPQHLNDCDAVLAMYHDQGLPVLKYQGFGEAINITLGLPIIRTSVDHGTAIDLAGKGGANHGSMLAAIQCAHSVMDNSIMANSK